MSFALNLNDILLRAREALTPSPLADEIAQLLECTKGFTVEVDYPSESASWEGETYMAFSECSTWSEAMIDAARQFIDSNPDTGSEEQVELTFSSLCCGRSVRYNCDEADLDTVVRVHDGKFSLRPYRTSDEVNSNRE